jgi:hypothetical protein
MEATAQKVTINFDWDPKRLEGLPDNIDKPTFDWVGQTLFVHVVEIWSSGFIISDKRSHAAINGELLTLCYDLEPAPPNPGQMVTPGVLTPVILNFTITGIPVQNYTIKIAQGSQ